MAGALHRLLSQKENELAVTRAQLKELSHSHTHTLVILHERNRDVERLNSIITSLRDQAISRDIELATAQQALHTSEADHDLLQAKQQSRIHVLEAQVADLHAQLDREEACRAQLTREHSLAAADLRDAAACAETELRREQAHSMDLRAHGAALQDRCASLQARVGALEAQEAALQDRCAQLQASTRAADSHGAAMQERCVSLQSRLAAAETEMGVLQQQLGATGQRARAEQEVLQQAVAMRDGRLAEQEVAMQQQLDASAMREREQLCQLDMLATKFEGLRASCEQQEREISLMEGEKARLEADKAQLRSSINELSAALTAAQMDRDRACEASARDAAMLRTTQLQLSTANSKLHEAVLRERGKEALAREQAMEARRAADRRMWDLEPSAPALTSPRCLSPARSPRPLDPPHAPSTVLDASRSALLRAQQTLDSFQAGGRVPPPPAPSSYSRALSPARMPPPPLPSSYGRALSPPRAPPPNISPARPRPPADTPEDIALRAEALKWAADGHRSNTANGTAPAGSSAAAGGAGGNNSGLSTNIAAPNGRHAPALMTSPRSPRPLPLCLSGSPFTATARAASAANKAMASAQAAQASARASNSAARYGSPLRPYSGPVAGSRGTAGGGSGCGSGSSGPSHSSYSFLSPRAKP